MHLANAFGRNESVWRMASLAKTSKTSSSKSSFKSAQPHKPSARVPGLSLEAWAESASVCARCVRCASNLLPASEDDEGRWLMRPYAQSSFAHSSGSNSSYSSSSKNARTSLLTTFSPGEIRNTPQACKINSLSERSKSSTHFSTFRTSLSIIEPSAGMRPRRDSAQKIFATSSGSDSLNTLSLLSAMASATASIASSSYFNVNLASPIDHAMASS
mmetsp:Transcript_103/g.365  ORF Transcript_103/g.365 Transcript_103/m.365 type:complete len:216 (-) Transcript_103:1445-2092(-)